MSDTTAAKASQACPSPLAGVTVSSALLSLLPVRASGHHLVKHNQLSFSVRSRSGGAHVHRHEAQLNCILSSVFHPDGTPEILFIVV